MADTKKPESNLKATHTVRVKKAFPQIFALRALAALSVCIFHLACGNGNLFRDENLLKTVSSYGYLGVDIFFIVSGFVICYALPDGYSLHQFKTFISKRLIRIEPPYVISILLVIFLNVLASRFNNSPAQFSWLNFFYHFAYLNNFGLGQYYSVVYWTLGIEFQFYLLIGLLYPIISKSTFSVIIAMLFTMAASFFRLKNMELVFFYLPFFDIGILVYFLIVQKNITVLTFAVLVALLFLTVFFQHGLPAVFASLLGLAGLLFFSFQHVVIRFFSNISFSLYLTHIIIGGKIINLGLRFVDHFYERCLLVLFAFAGSVFFAWVFYRIVEKPAMSVSKNIIYSPA